MIFLVRFLKIVGWLWIFFFCLSAIMDFERIRNEPALAIFMYIILFLAGGFFLLLAKQLRLKAARSELMSLITNGSSPSDDPKLLKNKIHEIKTKFKLKKSDTMKIGSAIVQAHIVADSGHDRSNKNQKMVASEIVNALSVNNEVPKSREENVLESSEQKIEEMPSHDRSKASGEMSVYGDMKVEAFKREFRKQFGTNVRVYDGRKFASDNATLSSIRGQGAKDEKIKVHGRTKVGNVEKMFLEQLGIKIQIEDKSGNLADDDQSLAKVKE
jgi:hypothetical protein